jgi:hypothetical protein
MCRWLTKTSEIRSNLRGGSGARFADIEQEGAPVEHQLDQRPRIRATGSQFGALSSFGNGRSRSKRAATAAMHPPTTNAAAEPPAIQTTPAPALAANAVMPIATS